MERIRELDRYQKGILLILILMAVVFSVVYPMVTSRVGFPYQDEILIQTEENGITRYTGEIQGKIAEFTVTQDDMVTFRHGEKTYGPYTVTEDPAVIPEDQPQSVGMKGIIVRDGEEVLFQGGLLYTDPRETDFYLYDEEGWNPMLQITATLSDGTVIDGNGNVVDEMEPNVGTVLTLIGHPELTHKGEWIGWFCGVLMAVVTTVSILFADEFFRWNLAFRVRDAYSVEPSDWAILERQIGWAVGLLGSLYFYWIGLR